MIVTSPGKSCTHCSSLWGVVKKEEYPEGEILIERNHLKGETRGYLITNFEYKMIPDDLLGMFL